jgi:uncharacterized membrane protein
LKREILGITACMLLVIAAFSPWMSIQTGFPTALQSGGSMFSMSANANNFALAAVSVLALALLLTGRGWTVFVPSAYAAVEFVRVITVWLMGFSTAPAAPSPFPNFNMHPGNPSPNLVFLVLGSIFGLVGSWRDFREAVRLVWFE